MGEPAAAGIVLAGGGSRRMGRPKATLEWHGSTLVRRAAGLVARGVDGPVVVVRAPRQELPPLPPGIEIATDAREGQGPVQGIAAGLRAIGDRAGVVYLAGVDTPLLHPAFIACVVRSLGTRSDAAVPRVDGFDQPLAAAYRTAALTRSVEGLLLSPHQAVGAITARLRVERLDETALLEDPRIAVLDPQLDSLLNLNTPTEYDAARARPAPRVTVRLSATAVPRTVRAATLAAAAAAVGIAWPPGVRARLDRYGPIADPAEPLAEGDELTFDTPAGRP